MTIADPRDSTAQHASAINDHSSCQPLEFNSTLQQARISACTIDSDDSETCLAQLRLTESAYNDVAPLGKGSNIDTPKTSTILNDFRDVVVSDLPAGLPQDIYSRRAVDGTVN
jgi:hypothetical protein